MYGLLVRAEAIARAAQRRRLAEIGASIGAKDLRVETRADSITIRGKKIVRRWLSDPLLRFASRSAR